MKLLSNSIKIGFCCLFLSLLIGACSKMDDTYKQFLEGGMKKYIGMVDSVFVYPGNYRIQLGWLPPSDPQASFARVYWNNRTDSVDVPIERTESRDTIKVMFDDFDEGTYVFEVLTFDEKGHTSLTKELVTRVYGDTYANALLSRTIDSYEINDGDSLRMSWGTVPDPAAVRSEVVYKDANGDTQTLLVPADENIVYIENFPGQTIEHRTVYSPSPLALDTYYTAYESLRIKGRPVELSKAGWTAEASSEDAAGNRRASNAIDDNTGTQWVNQLGAGATTYPHTITVNMGQLFEELEGFAIITRISPSAARPKDVRLYTSIDGINWTAHGLKILASTPEKQWIVLEEPIAAQYFRMVAENAHDNGNNIAVTEIGMYYR